MSGNFLKRFIRKYVRSRLVSVPVDNVSNSFDYLSKFDGHYDDSISTENYPNRPDFRYRKKDSGNTEKEFRPRVDTFQKKRSSPEDTMPSHKKPGHPKKDVKDTAIYKVSLAVPSNEKEQQALRDYKAKVESSGWLLTPMRSSSSDNLIYILSPKGSELELAAYIAASVLEEALGEAS